MSNSVSDLRQTSDEPSSQQKSAGENYPTVAMSSEPTRPKKQQRISQACDLCHRRSIRCRPSTENPKHQCQNCYDFGVDCTYNRPSRRRRTQGSSQASSSTTLPLRSNRHSVSPKPEAEDLSSSREDESLTKQVAHGHAGITWPEQQTRPRSVVGTAWRSFAVASQAAINRYLVIFMDTIHPIFPLFLGHVLWHRFRQRHHLVDRGFFASVMAACALAAARARDCAGGETGRFEAGPGTSSEVFFAAAREILSTDLPQHISFEYLRACSLLAITSIQYGHIQTFQQYIGHCTTLSAMQQFHDEARWPHTLTNVEREERHRLFWSIYRLDVYAAFVFGCVLKSEEAHANVQYPREVDDDEPYTGDVALAEDETHWLHGWNFITNLYRILEHSIRRMRINRQSRVGVDRLAALRMLLAPEDSDAQLMRGVMILYDQLPSRFKQYSRPVTGEKREDMYTLQAVNIQATLQLVRIVLDGTSASSKIEGKCDVVADVVSIFQAVDPQYIQLSSVPLLYQLGSLGLILASAIQGPLPEILYHRLRTLLLAMASMLQDLEVKIQPPAGTNRELHGASKELQGQIERLDQHMHAQRLASNATANQHLSRLSASRNVQSTVTASMPPQNDARGVPPPPMLENVHFSTDLVGDWFWPIELVQDSYMGDDYSYHPAQ